MDNIKHTNIHTVEVPEVEGREKRTEIPVENIMPENFSNLVKETDIHVWEAQRAQTR